MRRLLVCLAAGYGLSLGALHAQERKPGLYDVTVTTTTVSPSAKSYPPRTRQFCLTQQMIDKYDAIVLDSVAKACKLDVVKKPGGMTADISCTGGLTGTGTMKVDWNDSEHSKGIIHFTGTMQPLDTPIKIEWTATTVSVYKAPDCGVFQPPAP